MTQAPIAISTPGHMICAHCSRLVHHGGVVGQWQLRTCSDRACRDGNDGAWNLVIRVGDTVWSIGLAQRPAKAFVEHLSNSSTPLNIPVMAAACGSMWHGPVPLRSK